MDEKKINWMRLKIEAIIYNNFRNNLTELQTDMLSNKIDEFKNSHQNDDTIKELCNDLLYIEYKLKLGIINTPDFQKHFNRFIKMNILYLRNEKINYLLMNLE